VLQAKFRERMNWGNEAAGEEERREEDMTRKVTWSCVPSQSGCNPGDAVKSAHISTSATRNMIVPNKDSPYQGRITNLLNAFVACEVVFGGCLFIDCYCFGAPLYDVDFGCGSYCVVGLANMVREL
jgi:hypothetical protein